MSATFAAVALASAFLLAAAIPATARGAVVPWVAYEAEAGASTGGARVAGPGRVTGTVEGEASGRKAVVLEAAGASIEWTASAPANSLVARISIPDAPNGGGLDATLGLYVNGQRKASLAVTSRHSWVYGDYGNQTNDPKAGPARKVYAEANLLFSGYSIAQGDKVSLRKDAGDGAAWYAIDFIELEQVAAPLPMPAGYCSVSDGSKGWPAAVPNDDNSDDAAFTGAIAAAQNGTCAGVFIPAGTFRQDKKYETRKVKIQGAGMWHSKLFCPNQGTDDVGVTGFILKGDGGEFRDFAIFGWGGTRSQGGKAFSGSAYNGTVLERLWIANVHCGVWSGGAEASVGLRIKDCRFRDLGADAINLCNGNRDAVVENCHVRNAGDDAYAIWSARDKFQQACRNNVIRGCTAQLNWRAACFAIYGGAGNRIENCHGSDAMTYPGLTLSSEFNPFPMEGATIDGLTLERCGGAYWTPDQYFGAVWVYSADQPFANVVIRNLDIREPTYMGIHFQSGGNGMSNVTFQNVSIANPGLYGVQVKAGSRGSASFEGLSITGVTAPKRVVIDSREFQLTETGIPVRPRFTRKPDTRLSQALGPDGRMRPVLVDGASWRPME